MIGGAFLGFGAALLWTGAGFISFAYAEEGDKGKVKKRPAFASVIPERKRIRTDNNIKYLTQQWALSSVGGTIGSLIAFIINVHKTEDTGVSKAVYITFIIIMCLYGNHSGNIYILRS